MLTQATIDSMRAFAERLGAFSTIVADAHPEDPTMATEAEHLVKLADDLTDALAKEPVG